MNFMQEAVKEARIGIKEGHGGPFGAVVVKDGKIIGRGHNCVVKNNDPTCHGEIMAIRDACKNIGSFDLKGSVLYTTCYPCPMCLCAMMWANIEKTVYAMTSEDADAIGFRDENFYGKISDAPFVNDFCVPSDEKGVNDCRKLFADYLSSEHILY